MLDTFRYQYDNCLIYRQYVDLLGVKPEKVKDIKQIPFLPISLFKTQKIIAEGLSPEIVFSSSSTTGMTPSHHYVAYKEIYEESFTSCFKHFYGSPENYTFLALLPSYLEREGSSLVYMVEGLIKLSKSSDNGFFLYNHKELREKLLKLKKENKPVILFGVTFALLDFVADEAAKIDFPELIVIETGGMKGRGEELKREEVHRRIKNFFGINGVHSEYGMAELLSQSYSKVDGIFETPPSMKVLIRDIHDPFKYLDPGKLGGINIVDLSNKYSCSFIETEDMGMLLPTLSPLSRSVKFTVEGRFSNSEIRGCNMLL